MDDAQGILDPDVNTTGTDADTVKQSVLLLS